MPAGPPSSTRTPASSGQSSAALEGSRHAICDLAAALGTKDHYALLGIRRDATFGEIQSAFFNAAKIFHPDKLPPELADLHDQAAHIFGAMVEAHRILSDAIRRAAYDAEHSPPSPAPRDEMREADRHREATHAHQKAENLLKANDLAEAERLAERACDLDPSRAEHLALYGWLLAMKRDPTAVEKGLDLLDRSIALNSNVDRTRYWRGAILKRLRRTNEAMRDFRRAAELNPHNVDAVREMRLHQLRISASEGKGGVLSRLFKGKK